MSFRSHSSSTLTSLLTSSQSLILKLTFTASVEVLVMEIRELVITLFSVLIFRLSAHVILPHSHHAAINFVHDQKSRSDLQAISNHFQKSSPPPPLSLNSSRPHYCRPLFAVYLHIYVMFAIRSSLFSVLSFQESKLSQLIISKK